LEKAPPLLPQGSQAPPESKKLTMDEVKGFGIVGSILLFFGGVASLFNAEAAAAVAVILSFSGVGVRYVAVSRFSELVEDAQIRRLFIRSLVLWIVGMLIAIAGISAASGRFSLNATFTPESGLTPGVLLLVAVIYVIGFFAANSLRGSFKLISKHAREGLFNAAGVTYLIGALLGIVTVLKFISVVASFLEIAAWNSLPEYLEAGMREAQASAPPDTSAHQLEKQ